MSGRLSTGTAATAAAAAAAAISVLLLTVAGAAARAEEPRGWFSVTPQTWLSFVQTVDLAEVGVVKGDYFVPQFGATVAVAVPTVPGFDLHVTPLYGVGDGEGRSIISGRMARIDVRRLDVEALLRYTPPSLGLTFFAGPRYVSFREDLVFLTSTTRGTQEDSYIALQIGLAGDTSLGGSDRHRLFGRVASGVAFVDTRFTIGNLSQTVEGTAPLLSARIGYAYEVSSSLSARASVRTLVLFVNDLSGLSDTITTIGPEVGVRFAF